MIERDPASVAPVVPGNTGSKADEADSIATVGTFEDWIRLVDAHYSGAIAREEARRASPHRFGSMP